VSPDRGDGGDAAGREVAAAERRQGGRDHGERGDRGQRESDEPERPVAAFEQVRVFVGQFDDRRRDEEGDRHRGGEEETAIDGGCELRAGAGELTDRRRGDEKAQRQGADEDEDEGEGEVAGERFLDRGERVVGLWLLDQRRRGAGRGDLEGEASGFAARVPDDRVDPGLGGQVGERRDQGVADRLGRDVRDGLVVRVVDGHPSGNAARRVDDDPLRRRADDCVGGG
jgi:hypothetical protein